MECVDQSNDTRCNKELCRLELNGGVMEIVRGGRKVDAKR